MTDVIKRLTGVSAQFGGEQHTGWLPPGAARPLPTPLRQVLLNIWIESDGGSGFLMCYEADDGSTAGDFWFASRAEAIRGAEEMLGVEASLWN